MTLRARLLAGCVGIAVYAYAGYPVLMWAIARVRRRPVASAVVIPSLSVIIAAHNEAHSIDKKLASIFAQEYPQHLVKVIVASDGSTDRTVAVAQEWAHRGVQVLDLPRVGKARALDAAVAVANNDVLVMTDANAVLQPGALAALMRPFGDPQVGGVCGNELRRPTDGASAASLGERLYWEYDKWIKRQESCAGSIVAASGSLYALYRHLYRPVTDPAATDDFVISTQVVRVGKRLVFAEDAQTVEPATPSGDVEFTRKVRITTRGIRSVWSARDLLNPQRTGIYAVTLFSHKIVRRLVGFAAVGTFITSATLARQRRYRVFLLLQLLFYTSAAAGWIGQGKPWGRRKWLYIPYYACMSNLAVMLGILNAVRRKRLETWEPQREP